MEDSKNSWPLRLALAAQIFAIGVHGYLTQSYYQLKLGIGEGKSLCNISNYFNCDAASASPYSSFLGVPMALWGLFSNLGLLLMLFAYLMSDKPGIYRLQARALSAFIALTSLAMGFITFTKLNAVCLFCFAAYILSFISLAGSWSLKDSESLGWSDLVPKSFAQSRNFALSLLIGIPGLPLLINSMIMTQLAQGYDQAIRSSLDEWKTGVDLDLSQAKGMTKGGAPASSAMVIVEFADYQCIHCKMAVPVLSSFLRSRPDVSLIFQSFPLDGTCNSAVPRKGDGKSCELAKAAYCAYQLGKGWEVHDWIYENFGHVELAELSSFAESIGINMDQFRSCRSSADTEKAILDQAALGAKVGVKGTPTIIVNGRTLPRGNVMIVLEAAYHEIKKTH